MKEFNKIIDISWPIESGMVVYPKNPTVSLKHANAESYLTEIKMGSHTGTHVDAPGHVLKGGTTVEKLALKFFVGPCRVLDMTKVANGISLADVKQARVKRGERILVKTKNSSRPDNKFFSDFIYLRGEAADYLAKVGVTLFGIDYLSIKKRGSVDHRAHTSLLKKKIPIIEGLRLRSVRPGKYFLIATPLKLVKTDGSPIRAVLAR
jgi:arylformamidase